MVESSHGDLAEPVVVVSEQIQDQLTPCASSGKLAPVLQPQEAKGPMLALRYGLKHLTAWVNRGPAGTWLP